MTAAETPLVFMIAGEASGDEIGARLIAALKAATGCRIRFVGVGGEAMAEEGLTSLFPMSDLSVMGLVEVVPKAGAIFARMRQTARAIRTVCPDVVVTIDAPGFAGGVWRRLRGVDAARVHYVAPTVWAWRPGRAKRLARRIDHLLTLFPFEAASFQEEGIETTYVGHPALERPAEPGGGQAFRRRHGLADATVLGILPGSRVGEIVRLMPVMGGAARILAARRAGLAVVIPTLEEHAGRVAAMSRGWPFRTVICADRNARLPAMAACDAAIVASGTATLELALCAVPMVVGYRVNPVTALLLRFLLQVDYVTIVNIVLGRQAVPELLSGNCRADRLAAALDELIGDGAARKRQLEDARSALARLAVDGQRPSERAAEIVLDAARRRRAKTGRTGNER